MHGAELKKTEEESFSEFSLERALNTDGGAAKFLAQSSHQLGMVDQLLAGGITGAFSKPALLPLRVSLSFFQVQGLDSNVAALSRPSIWCEASRIINEEGFNAFWKGNMVAIAPHLLYFAVNFYAYERYKNLLHSLMGENLRGNSSANPFVHVVGDASAKYPLDLVRTRLAESHHPYLAHSTSSEGGVSLDEASTFKRASGRDLANVVVGISRLGGSSALRGKVGADEFGYMLTDILKKNDVETSSMRFDFNARTALVFVTLRIDGEREFLFFRNPIADMLLHESELDKNIIKQAL
ncbi:hypothetical protein VNO77_04000 [Canavalia gladiata]|uniref:Carbohydrate kinase PfkB domain-containing protein n=1 Tax=Canavalia gladiata TaxID=3824 RepID=A0AAN9RCS2_CANGL